MTRATAKTNADSEVSPDLPNQVPGVGRIEAFSDGVIAIIVTIMVLELKIPSHAAEGDIFRDYIAPLAPRLAIYGWSFFVVAIMWVNHHSAMYNLRHATNRILWANNHLLFWMSLIPLATGFWGEHPTLPRAVATYGLSLFATGASFTLLRWTAANDRTNAATAQSHRDVLNKSLTGVALYAVSIPLAFISVYVSMLCFVLVPAMFFRPTKRDVY